MNDVEDFISANTEYYAVIVEKVKEILEQYPNKEDKPDFAVEIIKAVLENLQDETKIFNINSVEQYLNRLNN